MENYFWNMQDIQPVKKMYVLIIYDIAQIQVCEKNEGLWLQSTEVGI